MLTFVGRNARRGSRNRVAISPLGRHLDENSAAREVLFGRMRFDSLIVIVMAILDNDFLGAMMMTPSIMVAAITLLDDHFVVRLGSTGHGGHDNTDGGERAEDDNELTHG